MNGSPRTLEFKNAGEATPRQKRLGVSGEDVTEHVYTGSPSFAYQKPIIISQIPYLCSLCYLLFKFS